MSRIYVITSNKFAVKLVRNDGNKEQCVGHVPIEHSKVFNFFLKRGGKIFATLTGNKFFNIGLELPIYKLRSDQPNTH
jgi:hypothetical protein